MYFTKLNNNTLLDHIYQKENNEKNHIIFQQIKQKNLTKSAKNYINMDKLKKCYNSKQGSKGVDTTFFKKAADKRSKPKSDKVYKRKRRDSATITLIYIVKNNIINRGLEERGGTYVFLECSWNLLMKGCRALEIPIKLAKLARRITNQQ